MSDARQFDILTFEHEGYRFCNVRAGFRGTERVVPPAGEDYAFDVDCWARHVQVSVSPTGRSVRVFVDGQEVGRG